MGAEEVYELLLEWAQEFDADFGEKLAADKDYAVSILAIGRGGKKPRKDLATWKEAKPYMGFFYDEYLEKPVFDAKFDNATVIDALNRFLACFDIADDSNVWFEKVKAITTDMGFTTDMKAYKADPTAYKGTVADISTMIRVAVTGKTNSPDLYTVMQILGYERTVERIRAAIEAIS
jgi:glutamyl-tRNA synthetase